MIAELVPLEMFVPEKYPEWREVVRESIEYVFSHLRAERLAAKIAEQMVLPANTPPERRLIRLISKMPGLQKLGQVLARNRRLAAPLREALCELENGMSDMTAAEVRAIIESELGPNMEAYGVEFEHAIHKEGSASAIIKFTWRKPSREREHGAFKVLKPYVPECFAEDMRLLQGLGRHFGMRDVKEAIADVRLLLEHELDFAREQATLLEAERLYRSTLGVRVPRLIPALSTARITAMSAENGVKVTEACRQSEVRRGRIASQVIEALIAAPLFSREAAAVFHADPHAGNILYDEPNRELVILDWALTGHLSLAVRRNVVMLAVMTLRRKPAGVSEAICGLSRQPAPRKLIDRRVNRFFDDLPESSSPGVLDAMMLLDELALEGVRFPSELFLFRKVLFTLDGVLHDIAGPGVRLDQVLARVFLTRCVASFGVFREPLELKDLWPAAQALTSR